MQLSDQRMDDGDWHDVRFQVEGNQMLITLDGKQFPTTLPPSEIARLYFYRLYIGGFDDMKNAPWPLYSRQGYKGCLESFKVNDIGKLEIIQGHLKLSIILVFMVLDTGF